MLIAESHSGIVPLVNQADATKAAYLRQGWTEVDREEDDSRSVTCTSLPGPLIAASEAWTVQTFGRRLLLRLCAYQPDPSKRQEGGPVSDVAEREVRCIPPTDAKEDDKGHVLPPVASDQCQQEYREEPNPQRSHCRTIGKEPASATIVAWVPALLTWATAGESVWTRICPGDYDAV